MIYKIAYDAGHGLNTPGKRSPAGEREWFFNNIVVLAFEVEMRKYKGIGLFRTDDPTGKVDISLVTRTNRANAWGADIYISFHHNALAGIWGSHTGTETFYCRGSANGYKLARLIQNNIVRAYGLRDRGLKVNNLHITRETNMPAALLEGGFMDSTIDIVKLRNNNVLKNAGKQIALAVAEYANLAVFVKDYMSRGDVSNQVRQLQLNLRTLGYTLDADGSYGPATENIVRKFQRDNKLTVDGIAGPKTQAKLKQLVKEREERIMATPSNQAKEPWERMTRQGIVDGSRPRDYMTRQEFAVAIDRLLFNDKQNKWSEEEIKEAIEKGITGGTNLGGLATREQVAAMIIRALKGDA